MEVHPEYPDQNHRDPKDWRGPEKYGSVERSQFARSSTLDPEKITREKLIKKERPKADSINRSVQGELVCDERRDSGGIKLIGNTKEGRPRCENSFQVKDVLYIHRFIQPESLDDQRNCLLTSDLATARKHYSGISRCESRKYEIKIQSDEKSKDGNHNSAS